MKNSSKALILLIISIGFFGKSFAQTSVSEEAANNAIRCAALFYTQSSIAEISEADLVELPKRSTSS